MSKFSSLVGLLFVSAILGCGGGGSESTASSELSGTATYRDAETDHAGNQRSPSAPPDQQANVYLIVKGSGTIPEIDPQCANDVSGTFQARYASTAMLSSDEGYVAGFGSTAAKITTPSGCEIPDLTVGVVNEIVVRGELTVNTQNCQTYCEANARSQAEAECGASPTAAQCRSAAETQISGQCNTTCTTQANKIVAEVSLGVGALGTLDASKLRGAAFGEISADLTFDRMEDAQGNTVGN